jgi:prophage DNA circulation protein
LRVDELHEASYRGATFYIGTSEIAGGRKDAKKEFVNSDLQIIEDLGLKQRIFTVNGIISDRRAITGTIITPYLQARDQLIDALETGGTGILIHPWYGRLEDIVCRTFTLNEDVTKLGAADITITFEVSNTDGIPAANPFVLTGVSTGNLSVITVAQSLFGEIWSIATNATGNFQAGVDKANSFVDAVNNATSPIAALSDEIDSQARTVSNFSSNIVTLVSNPATLAESITGVMNGIANLYAAPEQTLSAFQNLYDFGDDDIDLPYSTFIAVERKNNNDVFNTTVQATALSHSYLSASEIDYRTVESINEVEADLEAQYQKLFLSEDIQIELIDSLTELRTTATGFFSDKKLSASNIITVQTNPMSTRLLAFNYYGESTDGEAIAELNDLYDLAYHQGDIRIFTA